MFDIEIILRALHRNYRITQGFPVLWSNDADTRFDPVKGTVRNLKELARIRWSMATESREGAMPSAPNAPPAAKKPGGYVGAFAAGALVHAQRDCRD